MINIYLSSCCLDVNDTVMLQATVSFRFDHRDDTVMLTLGCVLEALLTNLLFKEGGPLMNLLEVGMLILVGVETLETNIGRSIPLEVITDVGTSILANLPAEVGGAILPFSLGIRTVEALPEEVEELIVSDSPALATDEHELLGTITGVMIGVIAILVVLLGIVDEFENSIFS